MATPRKKNKNPSPLRSQRHVGKTHEEVESYTERVKTAPPDGLTASEKEGVGGTGMTAPIPAGVIAETVSGEGERHRVPVPKTREPQRVPMWVKVVGIIFPVVLFLGGMVWFVAIRSEQVNRNSKDIEKTDIALRQLEKNHTQISERLLHIEVKLKDLLGKSEDFGDVKSQIKKLRQDLSDAMSKEAEERKMMQKLIDLRLQEIESRLEIGGEGK